MGSFINDVTLILTFYDPPPPSVMFHHKNSNPPKTDVTNAYPPPNRKQEFKLVSSKAKWSKPSDLDCGWGDPGYFSDQANTSYKGYLIPTPVCPSFRG